MAFLNLQRRLAFAAMVWSAQLQVRLNQIAEVSDLMQSRALGLEVKWGKFMSAYENATAFFHACESLRGWEGCQQYVAPNAGFVAQSEPIAEIDTVEGYTEWMADLGNNPLPGCGYELHASAYDPATRTALFFATFTGAHTGEGGPVPPTGQQANAHYVYALTMDDSDRVCQMVKIWNAPWTLRELGWAE